jgi:glutathione S-transferase
MTTTSRTLYHFQMSPFSRRTRLALAHKGLAVELKDGRAKPEYIEEARRFTPLKTMPVYVERDGAGEGEGSLRALADSTAITHYLDRAYPEAAPVWPRENAHHAFAIASLVDVALSTLVDAGTRYFALREHAAWAQVKAEMVGRAQRALDALGEHAARLGTKTVCSSGWSGADMWLFTTSAWLEGIPARAATQQNIAQVLSLGWTLPPALPRWADAHRARPDVRALDA